MADSDDTVKLAAVESEAQASSPEQIRVAPGSMVGRYVLFERVGAGGAGAVFRAFDPELSRYLGIKLLQSPGGTAPAVYRWRSRVMREAQALAQLSHPNVVAVHDVGVADGRVFIAMELIEGLSLREWQIQTRPTQRQIVEAYLQAGEGLAAAHSAGMVHRDFKPGNAAMGEDGRVRVLDFGLAKGIAEADTSEDGLEATHDSPDSPDAPDSPVSPVSQNSPDSADARDSGPKESPSERRRRNAERSGEFPPRELTGALLDTPMSLDGTVAGTLVYMAPEQLRAESVDARSDQFAFCVSLFEALTLERPYPSTSLRGLTKEKSEGAYNRPIAAKIPRRLRRPILRGLAPNPDDRFPDMRALLDALRRAQTRRAPMVALGLVGALAISGSVWGGRQTARPPANPCLAVEGKAALWTSERSTALLQAFSTSGAVGAQFEVDRLSGLFGRLDRELGAASTDVCEATHVRHVQSEALMDARGLCLDRARGRLEALLDAFERRASPDLVSRAYDMAADAGDISECSDTEQMNRTISASEASRGSRAELAAIEGRIDRADILRETGAREESETMLEALVGESESLAYPLGAARSRLLLAKNANLRGNGERARELLVAGLESSAAAGELPMAARMWTVLLDVTSNTLADAKGAEAVDLAADHAIRIAGDPPDLRGELELVRGSIALVAGKVDEALEHLRVDEALLIERYGPEHHRTARAYANVGGLLLETGDVEGAQAKLEHALAILERDVGDTIPKGTALINLGLLYTRTGDWHLAEKTLTRALEVEEHIAGSDSASLRWPLNGLGLAELNLGKLAEARALFTRSYALEAKMLGADHPALANTLANLASVAAAENDLDTAEAKLLEARALLDDDESSQFYRATIEAQLIGIELEKGSCTRFDELEALREGAAAERGESFVEVAEFDALMAECYLLRGDPDSAVRSAERAYAAVATSTDPAAAPDAALILAKTLQARGDEGDREAARRHAHQALEMLETHAGVHAYDRRISQLREWMVEQGFDRGG